MVLNRIEQHFCHLMEADPMVRRGLIGEWKSTEPELADQLDRLLNRFESEADDHEPSPPNLLGSWAD